jgi:hypothetical protein
VVDRSDSHVSQVSQVSHVSHVTGLAVRPNANTRMVEALPRVEAAWLDEAYERARATLQTLPMNVPGYRVVWWRGREVGHYDLPAHPAAYAVVGRHMQCDVVLGTDPTIALRHVMMRAAALEDGTVALRVLDLRTARGFYLDDDDERRSIAAVGPVALRIGRYALAALPSCAELPEARPPTTMLDAGALPKAGPPDMRTSTVTTLPPAPRLEEVARPGPEGAFARVTLRRGEASATVELTEEVLDAGLLVGRAERCEAGLRGVLNESVSRVHLLLLRERGAVHAFDLASLQGTFAAEQRVRRVRMPDRGATLRLAVRDPVLLDWYARSLA